MWATGNQAEKWSPISRKNTTDFMASIYEIYSPQQLMTLSKTFDKLTRLVAQSNTTHPKVSELISVMEVLRLHLPLLSILMGIYVSYLLILSQDQ